MERNSKVNEVTWKKGKISLQDERLCINYLVCDNSTNETIVFIPGHSDSSASYEVLIEICNTINNNFNYICLDIGWGYSDISALPYTKNNQLKIINSFLNQIVINRYSKEVHLVGHSMGGELVLMKGLEQVDTGDNVSGDLLKVLSITALAPASYPRTLSQLEKYDFLCRLPKVFQKAIQSYLVSPQSIMKTINKKLAKNSETIIDLKLGQALYEAVMRNNGVLRIFEVQRNMHYIKGSEFINEFPNIKTPLQIILAENDSKIAKDACNRFKNDFQNHTVKIYPRCSHYIHYEKPNELARDILGFVGIQKGTC